MFCFIHIEKNAGITLHHIFKNNSMAYVTLSPWSIWANDSENVFTQQEAKIFFKLFPYIQGFGGHTTRAYLEYEQVIGKPISYITFLREPVSRFLSQFFYQKNIMKMDWSIEQFIATKHFSNFMTKRICGKDDANLAMKMLKANFRFVGLTEYFDESLLLLKHELQLHNYNMHYEIKNKNPHKQVSQIPDSLIKQIRMINANDIRIYEFVKDELYPLYRKNYGDSLEKDVEFFRREQVDFKFNRLKLLMHGLLRHGMYKHVEKILHYKYHKKQ